MAVLAQMKILTKLELCNLYGLNVLRFSRDRTAKKRAGAMLAVWMVLAVVLIVYTGGLSYGLVYLGLEKVIPAYLIAISSLLVFFFGMLKAGSALYSREGYEILCALPVTQAAVAGSRFVRMYVENLLPTLAILLPGIAVYAWAVRPGPAFYLAVLLGIWAVPLLPMAGAVLVGALVTGISSRMRHKSLISSALSILAVLAIFYGISRFSHMDGGLHPEQMRKLADTVFSLLGKVYPPAVWLGRALMEGSWGQSLGWAALSLGVFVLVGACVSFRFRQICQSLFGSSARHDYEMGDLKEDTVLRALCRREFKRYFSSTVYLTNTIIGPIMSCLFSGALLFVDLESLTGQLPIAVDVCSLAPFAMVGMLCMMTTTSTSISMEGKNWWIVKSLPLSVKSVLDAKLLMNLLLLLPFYLLSELLMLLALQPGGAELVWMLLLPGVIILFSCVYGLTINLRFPVMDWESEVTVVKQSASAMLGGMGGFLVSIVCLAVFFTAPEAYANILKAILCAGLLFTTFLLYRGNCRKTL